MSAPDQIVLSPNGNGGWFSSMQRAGQVVVDIIEEYLNRPVCYKHVIESELVVLFALLTRKGWPLLALRNTDLTLEEVFLQLTSGDASHAAPAEPAVEVETEPENTEASEPEEAETKEDAEK